MKNKHLGIGILTISVLLLALMGFYKYDLDRRNISFCEASCGEIGTSCSIQSCPFMENTGSWVLTLSFALVFLLIGSGFYLVTAGKYVILPEKKASNLDLSRLDENEKMIYEKLKENKELYQSTLIKETGFSKVRITRILDKLESKNIIERKRRGMTNLIVLK